MSSFLRWRPSKVAVLKHFRGFAATLWGGDILKRWHSEITTFWGSDTSKGDILMLRRFAVARFGNLPTPSLLHTHAREVVYVLSSHHYLPYKHTHKHTLPCRHLQMSPARFKCHPVPPTFQNRHPPSFLPKPQMSGDIYLKWSFMLCTFGVRYTLPPNLPHVAQSLTWAF